MQDDLKWLPQSNELMNQWTNNAVSKLLFFKLMELHIKVNSKNYLRTLA